MSKKILPFLLGLLTSIAVFPLQGHDCWRAEALKLSSPLLALMLFYAIPFVPAFLAMSFACRLSMGVAWLLGWTAGEFWLLSYNWDAYLYCRAWGGCGTGTRHWYATTMLAPSALGKLTAWMSYLRGLLCDSGATWRR